MTIEMREISRRKFLQVAGAARRMNGTVYVEK